MRAIFLDRDGVINERRLDHVKSPQEFVFLPGALPALERLASTPFAILVVTNQAAVGRGQISAGTLEEIHRLMLQEVAAAGGRIDGVYACPHAPDERCSCRKPEPGLFLRAAREWNIDLARSYCVGDSPTDLEAASRAGCPAILVGADGQVQAATANALMTAPDLAAAVDRILALEAEERG